MRVAWPAFGFPFGWTALMVINSWSRVAVLLAWWAVALAAGRAGGAEAVHVWHPSGDTEVGRLTDGVRFYTDIGTAMRSVPQDTRGLSFTRRGVTEQSCDVTVDVPVGVACYLITGSATPASESAARDNGWAWVARANATGDGNNWEFEFYYRPPGAAIRATIPSGHHNQVRVAAANLVLDAANGSDARVPAQAPPDARPDLRPDGPRDGTVVPGVAAVDVRLRQTSINALEVFERGAGMIALGQTSELILTVSPATEPRRLAVSFVTPIGPEMRLARDEAERFVGVQYPNWRAARAELSFEDKYDDHEGGSIGAAVATLMMSAVEGIKIDPSVAMTGDISANGKVRAIGEVAAKLRGAAAARCTVVVLPADNYEQLVDAVIYAGPTIATDVQVLGASTLDEAISGARADRAANLVAAIQRFDDLAAGMKRSPASLKRPEAVATLTEVLRLAPNHLSAKCLLAVANGTAPRTLSIGASRYYAFTAGDSMLGALYDRAKLGGWSRAPSSVVRMGLARLRLLRPLADPTARPLIDAWVRFIVAADAYVDGTGSKAAMERGRAALLDELSKEQADPSLMQKLMRQGM